MALRIGGGAPKLPVEAEPEMPIEEQAEPVAEETPAAPEEESAEQLSPEEVEYKGPDQGPFMCSNCIHYGVNGEGTCEIVSGPIDEQGICNVFDSGGQQEMPTEEAQPVEEPMPEEPPIEQAP